MAAPQMIGEKKYHTVTGSFLDLVSKQEMGAEAFEKKLLFPTGKGSSWDILVSGFLGFFL